MEDWDGNGRLIIEQTAQGVFRGPKFNPRHIFQTQGFAVSAGLDNDVFKFLLCDQAAFGIGALPSSPGAYFSLNQSNSLKTRT